MSVTSQVISTLAYGETCAVIQRMQRKDIRAESLQKDLPKWFLLTFDSQLLKAAQGEGLVH